MAAPARDIYLLQAIFEVNVALMAMRRKQNSPTPPGHHALAGLDAIHLPTDHISVLRMQLDRIVALNDAHDRAKLIEDAHVLATAFDKPSPSGDASA